MTAQGRIQACILTAGMSVRRFDWDATAPLFECEISAS